MNQRHPQGLSRRSSWGFGPCRDRRTSWLKPEPLAAEPPPETTTLRLARPRRPLSGPQYVAEQLLRDEGFTEVQYAKKEGAREFEVALASGETNINMCFVPDAVIRLDAGDPIVILAGGHIGCFELFGTDQVRAVRDLKGKTVAVPELRSGPITFIASMAAYVGLDPQKDINWVTHSPTEAMQLLAEGKIDAFMGVPPELQELRTKHIGHVMVNGTLDRPWSQYFCCIVAGNREFVRKHPVATKRAVRAILKGADLAAASRSRLPGFS